MVKTTILGTEYKVILDDMNNDLLSDKDGYCQTYDKQIVIRKPEYLIMDGSDNAKQIRFRETLLHELVHGFSRESSTFYDNNEDLVEWMAEMIPKIVNCYDDILRQLKEEEKNDINM